MYSTVRHQNQKLMSAFDDVKCKWISRDHDQEAHLVRQSATALKRDNRKRGLRGTGNPKFNHEITECYIGYVIIVPNLFFFYSISIRLFL